MRILSIIELLEDRFDLVIGRKSYFHITKKEAALILLRHFISIKSSAKWTYEMWIDWINRTTKNSYFTVPNNKDESRLLECSLKKI